MTRDEHRQRINALLDMVGADNQAEASEILTELSEDYDETLTTSETLTTENTALKEKNEKLRSVNADLFLKVGTPADPNKGKNPESHNKNDDDIPSFDTLFNEKGELK